LPNENNPVVKQNNRDVIDDTNNIFENDKIILIIEDDYNFASVLYNLAHEHNFKALIALDGENRIASC